MNNKLLSTFLVIFMYGCATAQQTNGGNFSLSGKVSNHVPGEVLHLSYTGKDGKRVVDSVVSKDGSFSFKGAVSEPVMAYFSGTVASRRSEDPNAVSLFLEPAVMKLTATRDKFSQAVLTGSKTHGEYNVYQRYQEKMQRRWSNIMDSLTAANKRSNFEYQAMKNWVLIPYDLEMDEFRDSFMRKYPHSYATAFILRVYGRDLPDDTLKKIYANFPEKVKQSSYGKTLLDDIERRKIGVPGAMANNFRTTDINGKPVSLSDFKGKYVLLDFWASWCLPCRQLNPHLKELYTRYKDQGFEVIGVASDDSSPSAWKGAVAQDGLPWTQVLTGYKSNATDAERRANNIGYNYNIHELPTHVLIDRTGKIIARYGGGGEDHKGLDAKLQSVFK